MFDGLRVRCFHGAIGSLAVMLAFALAASSRQVPAQVGTEIPGGPQATQPAAAAPLAGLPQTSVQQYHLNPLNVPTLSPGVLQLLELEGRFAEETASGGGRAFARWFAEDAVILSNGKPAVTGRGAIAETATWDPKQYSLSWTAQGAQMGTANDMGYTWGHYEGRSTDRNGAAVVTTGRYITIWKKQPDGAWKVVLDASADEPPDSRACCSAAKP